MSGKILVVYASRAGSSREVAETIARELGDAEVKSAREVRDLAPYRAVVAGGAIHMGRFLPEMTKWLRTQATALSQLPVAYFAVCMTLKENSEKNRCEVAEWLAPLSDIAKPVSVGLFAGKMDYKTLPFLERFIVKNFIKAPEFDARDWEGIRAWAAGLEPLITEASDQHQQPS